MGLGMTIETDDIEPNDELELEADEVVEGDEPLEGDEPGVDEGGEEPAPRQGRLNNRLEALRQQAREAQEQVREEAARRRELEEQLRTFQRDSQQRQQYYDEQAEAERLSNMSLEERLEYNLAQATQRQRQFEQQQQLVMADAQDKAAFSQLATALPELAELAPQVEVELNALRTQRGWNVPREVVVATLIGYKTLQQAKANAGKQRSRGQENIRRQKTPAAGGQSDVQRRNRRELSPRDRLEGKVF